MSQLSVGEFLSLLRQSNVLSARQWAELRQELLSSGTDDAVGQESTTNRAKHGAPNSIAEVVDWLIARDWLTRWQADMLLARRPTLFLGKYRLLECVGTGGMGAVFKARHGKMGRTVALKVMSAAIVQDAKALARFRNEIQAAAALNHPNIVNAYDADCAGKMHFLVMEYVNGHDLGWYVNQKGTLPIEWVCECIRQTALGLQHAHERGMVHRDIKPTNVLVARDRETGRPVAKLLDLGLARFASEADSDPDFLPPGLPHVSELTQAGQVLGTPDYIAPEQAANTSRADARSDIYSLGCTLFRLITGVFPFPGETAAEKIQARQEGNPRSLRELRPEASRKLEAVVMKMMARDPDQRFHSARDVAEALTPFTLPREPSLLQIPPAPQSERSSGSNVLPGAEGNMKDLFSHLTMVAVDEPPDRPLPARPVMPRLSRKTTLLVLGLGGGAVLAAALGYWMGQVTLIVDWPPEQRHDGTLVVDGRRINLSQANLPQEIRVTGRSGPWDVRLTRPGHEPLRYAFDATFGEQRVYAPQWRPTAKTLRQQELAELRDRAASSSNAEPLGQSAAQLRADLIGFRCKVTGSEEADAAARILSKLPSPFDGAAQSLMTDERLQQAGIEGSSRATPGLVAAFGDARFKFWNRVISLSVSYNGRFIAAASLDGTVRILDRQERTQGRTLRLSTEPREVLFSPASDLLAVAGSRLEVTLWDPATGNLQATLRGAGAPLAFSPDGKRLAAGARRQEIGVFDPQSGNLLRTLPGHATATLRTLSFSPDGTKLASYAGDASVALWDLNSSAEPRRFVRAHRPRFSPDSRRLAAGSGDIRLWNCEGTGEPQTLKAGGDPLAFTPDGRTLISFRSGRAILWDLESGEERRTIPGVPPLAVVSPDGATLAAAKDNVTDLRFWSLPGGELISASDCRARIQSLVFTPNSKTVISASSDFAVRQWDPKSGREDQSTGPAWGPVACDPEGRHAAIAQGGKAEIWDLTAPDRPVRTLAGETPELEQLAWSPQGRWIAGFGGAGFFKLSLRLWDSRNGRELSVGVAQSGVLRTLEFGPGGERLATASDAPHALVWDVAKRAVLGTLDGAPANPRSLAFDRKLHSLAAAGANDSVVVWNLQNSTGRPFASPAKSELRQLAFAPDGQHVIAAAVPGLLLWDVDTGKVVRTLSCKPGIPTCLSVSPTGDRLAAAGNSGTIWVWNLESGKLPAEEPDQVHSIGPTGGVIQSLNWATDSRHLLSVNGNSTLYVLRVTTDEEFDE